MPILYVHGVNTRSRDGFFAIKPYLERLVAPVLAENKEQVNIDDVYWGDLGVKFAWDGASRPSSRLLGMGAGQTNISLLESALTASAFSESLKSIVSGPAPVSSPGGLISGGAGGGSKPASVQSLQQFDASSLSDLLVLTICAQMPAGDARAHLALMADEVALEVVRQGELSRSGDVDAQIQLLLDRIRGRVQTEAGLAPMGVPAWLTGVHDRLAETVKRALGLPAYTISIFAAEVRKPLNEMLSVFIGDVFEYLTRRGDRDAPGEIPSRFLAKLNELRNNAPAGEPLLLLSHSMGGQIVYDAVTHFLPVHETLHDLRIDFWCATASQVGFFVETKMVVEKHEKYHKGKPVPFPGKNLKAWWNVWDHNDFLSFTANGIIEGVDDESYDSGMSLLAAHGGYLDRPSFYRRLAKKVRAVVA